MIRIFEYENILFDSGESAFRFPFEEVLCKGLDVLDVSMFEKLI